MSKLKLIFLTVLTVTCLLPIVHAAKRVGYGSKLTLRCPGSYIFALFDSASPDSFLANCAPAKVCEKFRTCTPGVACSPSSRYGYVHYAREGSSRKSRRERSTLFGDIIQECCQLQFEPQENVYEFCSVIDVAHNTTSGQKADVFKLAIPLTNANPSRYVKHIQKTPTGYIVTQCYLQCSSSTTTTSTIQPRTPPIDLMPEDVFKEILQPKKAGVKNFDGGANLCFDADGTVHTPSGPKAMRDLKVADQVLTNSDTFGTHSFERVKWFIHRDPQLEAEFLTLETESGHEVTLTEKHLLPIVPCDYQYSHTGNQHLNRFMKPAGSAQIGNCVLVNYGRHTDEEPNLDRTERIVNIRTSVRQGIYSPVTESGTIIVNGVHCGVHMDTGPLAHMFHAAVFKILNGIEKLFHIEIWKDSHAVVDIPRALQFLMEARSIV